MTGKYSRRLFLTLGFTSLIVSGCEKGNQNTTTDTSSGSSSGTTTNTSAGTGSNEGGAGGKKYKIVYIPKNTGNPYFGAVEDGLKKAATELGYEYSSVAPATADAGAQIPFIKEQAQRGVDAIIITPNSPEVTARALKEVMAKKIRVITVDADLTGHEDSRDAGILPTDAKTTGQSLVELMSGLTGGKGDFAILSATTDAPNQNQWIKYMKDTLQGPKYKDLKLVDTVYGNDDSQKSQRETEALLTKYPNLRGIVAPTSVGIKAAAQVVEGHKVADKVQVTGLGLPSEMRRFVKNGTVKKFALWNPSDMGYLAGQIAVGLLKGDIKAAPGTTFKAGSLGEHKFGDKNVVITGPPLVFDQANIDQFKF
ncbi:MAG: rhamnose ABC transporter substrate-binding protein [Abitibacteriaceae bacterium]|nr:rhamnose ABC transporter substrate-binding protein [Abditibacteriaceae bacterium]